MELFSNCNWNCKAMVNLGWVTLGHLGMRQNFNMGLGHTDIRTCRAAYSELKRWRL